MKKIIVIGAGGLGAEIKQYIHDCSNANRMGEFKGYLDDTMPIGTLCANGGEVLGSIKEHIPVCDYLYLVGIGDVVARDRIYNELRRKGAKFARLIHPLSYISEVEAVGEGGIFCPFSFVGVNAVVGENVLMNIYSSIGHDTKVGKSSILSPYATANGWAVIENGVFLGSSAVITSECVVKQGSKVAAGSVVYSDVPEKAAAFGNPARVKI